MPAGNAPAAANAALAEANANDQPTVNVTMPSAPEVWTENPTQGDFNPGTKSGEAIFKMKTKGLPDDKRINFDKKNAPQFRRLLQAKGPTFGATVTSIPVEFDARGNVTKRKNLISEYPCIELDTLKRAAHSRFGTALANGAPIPAAPWTKRQLNPATSANDKAAFYEKVHSHVIAEWLKNVLDEISYASLLLKKKEFTFTSQDGTESYDGLVMLKLVLTRFDPSVAVGVEKLRVKLETFRLFQYGNNVDSMCTAIEETMRQIEGLGKECESIRRYTITALSSGPNAKFNTFIDRINDNIESGTGVHKDMDWQQIIDAARSKYTNMDSVDEWDKVDPRDAKLAALSTEVKELRASKSNNSSGGSGKDLNSNSKKLKGGVEEWRTIKKGDTMQVDGRTVYWCPHHKHPKGEFDGLYCWHKPENHDEWKSKMRQNRTGNRTSTNPTGNENGNPLANLATAAAGNDKKLSLNDRLKSVLCSKLMLSDEDAANICKEICQEK